MINDAAETRDRRSRSKQLRSVHGLILILLTSLPLVFKPLLIWPTYLLAPLVTYGLIVLATPSLRSSVMWLRTGRLNTRDLLECLGSAVCAAAALVLWLKVAHPDLVPIRHRFPFSSTYDPLLVGSVFAVLNATLEEFTWRGVMQDALEAKTGTVIAVVLQALGFGFQHAGGIPFGAVGVVLATAFGIMMGALRARTGGLLTCCTAHAAADAAIFIMVRIS